MAPVMTARLTTGPWTTVTAGEGIEEQAVEWACSWRGDLCSRGVEDGDSILVILTSSSSWLFTEFSDAVLLMAESPEEPTKEAGGSYREMGEK